MRLFTEIEPASYEKIQELVQEGRYDSVEQFLRVAAQNQLAIERSEGDDEQTTSNPEPELEKPEFHWGYSPPQNIPTRPAFNDDRDEILLFSQYYRFFPLKCVLYKLAEVTSEHGGSVPLAEARTYVAETIWPIREAVVEWEKENDIKKQNRKSTGFPKDKDQSMMRYIDHYLGKVKTQKGRPAGFGHDLGYISFQDTGSDWEVQLTPAGSRFVKITNPLLENGPTAPTLSDQEQAFIISTIQENLHEEYHFMDYVYDILFTSEGSYTDHLDAFREFLEESPGASDDPSDNSVRSTVGGAISRMVELGVLERGRRRGWYDAKRHPDEYETLSVDA